MASIWGMGDERPRKKQFDVAGKNGKPERPEITYHRQREEPRGFCYAMDRTARCMFQQRQGQLGAKGNLKRVFGLDDDQCK